MSRLFAKTEFIVLLICLSIQFGISDSYAGNKTCTKLLNRLGDTQSKYVDCSTKYAVPVHLCITCEPHYQNMSKAYQALLDNSECKAKYFNNDRLNVVETTQTTLTHIWQKAFCDDCFISNYTAFALEKDRLDACLETKTTKCESCLANYDDLKIVYKTIDEKNHGKVCFDMQDAMNKTRIWWSKNCCKRDIHIKWFLIVTSCFAVLPVSFYITAVLFTRRNERNPQLMHINAQTSSDQRQLIVGEPAAPASTPPAQVKKLPKLANYSDSDSDDDFPPYKPQKP